jgi:RimJ/RimL family protein N-acetyltransferase
MEPALRDATIADAQFLFELRTDPDVAAASNTAGPPSLERHVAWLARALENPDVKLFIIEDQGPRLMDVGQVRLDLKDYGNAAEVSIALIRAARGQGTGTAVLKILALAAADRGIRWLEAVIKETNHASRKAFLKAGYSVEEIKDGLVHMGFKCGS